jgi:uncharacterized protein YueI
MTKSANRLFEVLVGLNSKYEMMAKYCDTEDVADNSKKTDDGFKKELDLVGRILKQVQQDYAELAKESNSREEFVKNLEKMLDRYLVTHDFTDPAKFKKEEIELQLKLFDYDNRNQ